MYFESFNSYELSGLLGELIACRLWPSRASRCDIGTQSSDSSFVVMVCSHWPNQESWLRHHPCISILSAEYQSVWMNSSMQFFFMHFISRCLDCVSGGVNTLQADACYNRTFWHLRQLLPVILETRSMLALIRSKMCSVKFDNSLQVVWLD